MKGLDNILAATGGAVVAVGLSLLATGFDAGWAALTIAAGLLGGQLHAALEDYDDDDREGRS